MKYVTTFLMALSLGLLSLGCGEETVEPAINPDGPDPSMQGVSTDGPYTPLDGGAGTEEPTTDGGDAKPDEKTDGGDAKPDEKKDGGDAKPAEKKPAEKKPAEKKPAEKKPAEKKKG